ncbi:MAG TPA: S9 family peptidase [Patescibacteria group bacterium]|nr:S9 family peptidase [Patescibacteria group bacterium]
MTVGYGKIAPAAAALVAVLAWCASVSAGECFTSGDLLMMRWCMEPVFSPDGRWIAYVVQEPPDTTRGDKTGHSDIWVADFEGKRTPRRFAFGPSREHMPRWSPDGRWIAFLSDRASGKATQLYRIRFAGGEAGAVTAFKEDVQSFTWSPDGKKFAVVVADPLPEDVTGARERGDDERVIDREFRFGRLRIIDASAGTGDPVTPEDLHVMSAAWSPDAARIAMIVADRPTSNEMYYRSRLEVLDLARGERTVLSDHGQGTPSWSPDGRSIAFLYRDAHPEITIDVQLVAVVDADGSNLRLLGKTHCGTFADPHWHPGGERLVVFEMSGVTGRLALLSIEDESVEPLVDMLVPYYGYRKFDVSRDGSRFVFLKGDAQSPPDICVMERGWFGKNERLTDLNGWLTERDLPSARTVGWKSRDGTVIEGVLLLPPGYQKGNRYPAVINIHGGPMWAWWLGWHGTWHEWGMILACRGYIVLLPNPRGSAGYGPGFARANFDDWGGGDYEDILAGADFLVDEGYAVADRIGVGGWSYGGYMSAWIVSHTRRFAAAVVGAGVTNLYSFHGTTDITPDFLGQYLRAVPYRRPDAYRAHSPVTYVDRASTPTLILHGEGDARVPVGQAYEMYHALVQTGVPAELVVYPREQHGFNEIHHQIDLVDRVVAWFDRYLRP